jgi:tRNA-specific 2-thiouridylase
MSPQKKRVIVGLSGGVDSAVAALLLVEQGYEVEGLFMQNWEDEDEASYCTSAQDFQDARQVAAELRIPLHRVNFTAEYQDRVFRYFLDEYAAGRTPNPDVLCNTEIKFKAFLEYAERLGAARIATGHYACLAHDSGATKLLKAADAGKDQTYFLHAVRGDALARCLFPLSGMQKSAVRALAVEAGFDNYAKKDSTGICFIGERNFRAFLGRYLPAQPGEMRTPEGELVGEHQGLMYYTLGQRQGLGIGGQRGAAEEPWYVVDKDLKHNILVVAQGRDHPLLYHNALTTGRCHWIADQPPAPYFTATAKIRYRQREQPCQIELLGNGTAEVLFHEPQWAITPGQYAVFYNGETCLGGGVIERVGDVVSMPACALHR